MLQFGSMNRIDDPRNLKKNADLRAGYKEVILEIPVLKVMNWFKNRKKKATKVDYEWAYDGCGCMPPEGYRSDPYCHEHYNPLIRRRIKL